MKKHVAVACVADTLRCKIACARKVLTKRVWFIVRNVKRVFDELQFDAGGEKPQRQQHIHNEHAQKLHSHIGRVANSKM